MILCDTNILIEFYKGNEKIANALRNIGISNLAVSIITTGELYFGARDKHELKEIQTQLSLINQLSLDSETSQLFLSLMEQFVLSHKLSIPDALIAATALRYDTSLYTLNVKDFHYIPGIQLYNSDVEPSLD